MKDKFETIRAFLKQWNVELTNQMESQLLSYYDLLIEWNQKMNLTAVTEFEDVLIKHFLDSLSILRVWNPESCRVIDIGTGAGFPGIPIKIVFPQIRITLLDSLNKRIRFLDAVIESLGLQEIEAVHARSEDLAGSPLYRESFDLCVSRAVANLSVLSEYCLPYVRRKGFFIAYKSSDIAEELKNAQKAIQVLGGEVQSVDQFSLPGTEYGRSLLKIHKIRYTPNRYPRKAGIPTKNPIQ